jgi:hypothetical protein
MEEPTKKPPIKPEKRPHCYICGATDDLSDDDLPPKGFFPPNDRKDLIKAPLCRPCHKPLAKGDETMRAWLAAAGGKSQAGKWIWENKVMGSTFRRSPELLKYIREKHFQFLVNRETGEAAAGVLTFPQADAVPFIRRLTKGCLYTFHPDYDYFSDHFAIEYRQASQRAVDDLAPLVKLLPQEARGDGVFRVWHGLAIDTKEAGACAFVFYEAVCFVCFFGRGGQFKQQFPAGYKERDDLPPHL